MSDQKLWSVQVRVEVFAESKEGALETANRLMEAGVAYGKEIAPTWGIGPALEVK